MLWKNYLHSAARIKTNRRERGIIAFGKTGNTSRQAAGSLRKVRRFYHDRTQRSYGILWTTGHRDMLWPGLPGGPN
jgi:hypothetical protein